MWSGVGGGGGEGVVDVVGADQRKVKKDRSKVFMMPVDYIIRTIRRRIIVRVRPDRLDGRMVPDRRPSSSVNAGPTRATVTGR